MNYSNLIDTIKLKGKCRLTKGGGSLFQYCDSVANNNSGNIKFPLPITSTAYRHGRNKVAEMILSQQFDGKVSIYTHKDFTAEYGYSIYIQNVPPWLLYSSSLPKKTAKMQKAIRSYPIWVEITIPSVSGLWAMDSFTKYMTTTATSMKISDMLWGYITSMHDFERYGIRVHDVDEPLDRNDLDITQIDIAQNIRGRLVVDVLDLVSRRGYYARKNMRLWNNTSAEDDAGITTYRDANGIEFRKGQRSSEIYKFYDKELQIAQTYYDAIYTAESFTKERALQVRKSMEEKDRTMLRYEVSLRKVPSVRNAIDKKYAEGDEIKRIRFTDIMDDTIYSRTPQRILRDGLLSIFGGEIAKDMTTIFEEQKAMTDTELLQEYKGKGLKYLGIKYLLDKGRTNDTLWKYLYERAGQSYEVVRRLRNEMKELGIIEKLNDNDIRTMDTLRGVYKDLDTAVR